MQFESKVTEESVIRNSKPNHLYNHDFGKGRFFQVVHEDTDGFTIKLASRTMFKAIYKKDKDDIEGIEIIKLVDDTEKQKVAFSKFNFAQLKSFLKFLDQIDLKGISERRIKLIDEDNLDETTIRKIRTLLSKEGGQDIIESLINEGIITSKDIVNTGFRKRGLNIFEKLLNEPDYWKEYADELGIKDKKEEKVWQAFFEKNEWIFGYGLDYRFQSILQREAHLSSSEIGGGNTVIADYLMGDKRFTTFVELKKPSTPLFGKSKNRSNAWCLSSELIDSVSQILEQKASGLLKLEEETHDTKGVRISQKAYDSNVVLIIGRWNEVDQSMNDLEVKIKNKTLELFRRDSRNIDILTYDELFDRAKYIVQGEIQKEPKAYQVDEIVESAHLGDDDLPF